MTNDIWVQATLPRTASTTSPTAGAEISQSDKYSGQCNSGPFSGKHITHETVNVT